MFTSAFLVTLLGIVTGQGTVVKIEQSNLPLRNDSMQTRLRSSIGTLEHVQTLQLVGVGRGSRFFRSMSSLVVTANGSQILFLSSNGRFVDLKIQLMLDGTFDVLEGSVFTLRDTEGYTKIFPAEGLAIEGVYQGGGKGNFFVSSLDGEVYRLPEGIQAPNMVDLGLTDVFADCFDDSGTEAILRPRNKSDFSLLMFCRNAMSLAPTSTPGKKVFIGFAYDEDKNIAKRFYVESTGPPRRGNLHITDIAELSNGDIMILFSEFYEDIMTIGYVRRRALSRAASRGRTVRPVSIANISRSEGYNIGEELGLAVREDPRTNQTFVYIVNDNLFGEAGVTLLSTFLWTAGR